MINYISYTRRWLTIFTAFAALCTGVVAADTPTDAPTFTADNKGFVYMGRVDFTNPKLPRFWSPGVTIEANFKGTFCDVLLNDQVLWGNTHNYVEIVVDGVAKRYQTTGASNVINAAEGLPDGVHSIVVCKDTESGIGYLEFVGLRCEGLAKAPKLPKRKIEFIGDSITAGAGTDTSELPCDQGSWYAHHNAYLSYGPDTARDLNSQWAISAVSGIGLIHSCCGMTFTMPDAYDQLATRASTDTYAQAEAWDPKRYVPDVITICLGQNDGTANPDKFVSTDETFVEHLHSLYPKTKIVLLTSPMGSQDLTKVMSANLAQVVSFESTHGDSNVSMFAFDRAWNDGCGTHPSIDDDIQVSAELSGYLKTLMHW